MARIATECYGKNVNAFLDVIAASELGALVTTEHTDDGYRVIVGSTPSRAILLTSYAAHPRVVVHGRYGYTDAAGRYQIMAAVAGLIRTDTWDWASVRAGVSDFSPESQDRTAVELLAHRGALALIQAGQFDGACAACAKEWASLPNAGYGQHENKLSDLRTVYLRAGGELA